MCLFEGIARIVAAPRIRKEELVLKLTRLSVFRDVPVVAF